MKNIFLFLLMVSMTALLACKGDQGLPGRDGLDGTNGADGNANVKSWTIDIIEQYWEANGSEENHLELFVPIVTQAVADHGLVMVYFKTYALGLDGTTWTALPFSLSYSPYIEAFSFSIAPDIVRLKETVNNGFTRAPRGTIRVVAATADGLAQNPDLDWTHYEAVEAALNLAD